MVLMRAYPLVRISPNQHAFGLIDHGGHGFALL
jgi:hypothetical protein